MFRISCAKKKILRKCIKDLRSLVLYLSWGMIIGHYSYMYKFKERYNNKHKKSVMFL